MRLGKNKGWLGEGCEKKLGFLEGRQREEVFLFFCLLHRERKGKKAANEVLFCFCGERKGRMRRKDGERGGGGAMTRHHLVLYQMRPIEEGTP